MATAAPFALEERLGLGIAVAAHVALFAFLALYEPAPPARPPVPDRMDVSLASEVSLTSTSPNPAAEQQAAIAPVLAPEPAPPEPEPQPAQRVEAPREQPRPVPTRPAIQPKPRPTVAVQPVPRPSSKPSPKPSPRATSKPQPKPAATSRPAPQPSSRPSTRPSPQASASTRGGGSRIGSDFLTGASAGERTQSQGAPAATFGAAEQAGLQQAINRQLKPHWTAPQGVDAELLVTELRWELNEDGSLKGRPEVVRQTGINDSNRAQASLHAERAIRAVQLAAPFDLPPQFYDKWKRIRTWRFDRRL